VCALASGTLLKFEFLWMLTALRSGRVKKKKMRKKLKIYMVYSGCPP
jgi:hypothetical protein